MNQKWIQLTYCSMSAVLVRLQTTKLNWLHSFIADSTSRYYNHSFTLSSDLLMSCLGAVRWCPLFTKAAGQLTSCLECWPLSNWMSPHSLRKILLLESESYVTTDGQSASLSWYKAPIRGLRPEFYCRTDYGIRLTVTFLIPWGAISDERTGLSFVCAAGPC
jgi:hypothetical protein